MNIELISALALFAFIACATPGPNNIMLFSSGANFGFRLSIPHMAGVSLGFMLIVLFVGLGAMRVFEQVPTLYAALKVACLGYLLFLAWKIATATGAVHRDENTSQPLTFFQAALFQWVNPKAWAMALTAISVYAPTHSSVGISMVAIVFWLVNLPCICSWVLVGNKIYRLLTDPVRARRFNILMATLLVLSVLPALVTMY